MGLRGLSLGASQTMTSVRSLRGQALLRAQGLAAGWGASPAIRAISFEIERGERVALLGPNGAGKSTLFDCLTGRLRPSAGRVFFGGTEVTGQPLHRLATEGLAYVPQEPTALLRLSVEENLVAALESPARRGSPRPGELDRSLEDWGLTSLRQRPSAVLSGGERRRLEVARALLLRPRLLILDEPFAGLDPAGRSALRAGLGRVHQGTAVLVSDHATDDVFDFAERVILLVDGGLAYDGPTSGFSPELPVWHRYFAGASSPSFRS